MRRRAALAAAVLLGGAAPSIAQEPTPLAASDTIVSLSERGCCLDDVRDGAVVEGFEIVGNEALDSGTIRNALWTEKTGWIPWSEKKRLSKDEFLKDLLRVHVLYQRWGYFDARLESYSVTRDGESGVRIELALVEGEPTLVDSLVIDGLEGHEEAPAIETLYRHIPLKKGEVFNELDLLMSRDTLEAILKNGGHAFAQVLMEYRILKDQHSARVTYTADPGDVYWIGNVAVRGYEGENQDLILNQMRFRRGDRYDRQAVLESQRRVYELALFRRVDIAPQLASVRGDTVDVVVTVVPAPTHVVRVGVGYGTEDLFRVSASWLDRNLLGEARQLEVRGQYSRLERDAAITYRQPTFIARDVNLTAGAFLRFETEPNYTVERIGVSSRLGWRPTRRIQVRFGSTYERDDFSDFDKGVLIPEFGREFINPSRLFWADAVVTYDDTDSLFTPTRGTRGDLVYQVGLPVLGGDYAYHRLSIEAARFFRVREGWVLAVKVLPGAIFTYGGDPEDGGQARVPLFQRLFAGGANSVRGYPRRQLGPKDDPASFGQKRDPEPIGGEALFEATAELRFPLRGKFRGAVFVDAGNVWLDPGDISIGDLKYTPGVGLRYATPIGPVRLDVARRLSGDVNTKLPRTVFHISIGNPF